MHLLVREGMSLDESAPAEDLDLPVASLLALSFSDADLVSWLIGWDQNLGTLQAVQIARLRHPMSVDLFIEKSVPHAKGIIVRLLGGLDYWRYGAEELARACRRHGVTLAIVPGDGRPDPRLCALSTISPIQLAQIEALLDCGGTQNVCAAFRGLLDLTQSKNSEFAVPEPLPLYGEHALAVTTAPQSISTGTALIIFYRSNVLSGDTKAIEALGEALSQYGLNSCALYVPSLKSPEAANWLTGEIERSRPTIILNATAFSGRNEDARSPLDVADCPVIQVVMAQSTVEQHAQSARGLSAQDLAMHVVLPEVDGRILGGAIAFKTPVKIGGAALEVMRHEPWPEGIEHVARLAVRWSRLGLLPRAERKVALILSTYPGRSDQIAHAVGLDGPESALAIARSMSDASFDITGIPPDGAELLRALTNNEHTVDWPLADYQQHFANLPEEFQSKVIAAWGQPEYDQTCIGETFTFSALQLGKLTIALQPERGIVADRKASYHDPNLPPRHAYIAFYLWLRHATHIDALIHLGAHGTVEWLPGKAAALTPSCASQTLLGDTPLIYPFIVNDPGEAAQAKRRTSAVTIGHMTPPLVTGAQPHLNDVERLIDEFSSADGLDQKRRKSLAKQILDAASSAGIGDACGLSPGMAEADAIARIDAFLCDVKELAIRDGLHILDTTEISAIISALDGRFIPPGPSGAPSRGRPDVLPTGRNLYAVDPRTIPTRTALQHGRAAAAAILARYMEDHGDWPRAIVVDMWGSATLRTGGEELAMAMALLGVMPVWDHNSARVSGFEVIPLAKLDRPRVDVTLRISGLFRDMFPDQIALFDHAVQKVAALDEDREFNPLREQNTSGSRLDRVFGAPLGAFGTGVMARIDTSNWSTRDELGQTYLSMSGTAYRADGSSASEPQRFCERVAAADSFVHVQDHSETDLLTGGDFAAHEGGFAAAAASTGNADIALYHADTANPSNAKIRTLKEETARVVHGRATNPLWIGGQMRHGYRGAAEMASTVDAAFAFAASSGAVESSSFERLYDAYLGDPAVRQFISEANPAAIDAMRARFNEAIARGLWRPRRNDLGELSAEAAQ